MSPNGTTTEVRLGIGLVLWRVQSPDRNLPLEFRGLCNLAKASFLPHQCGMHPLTKPYQPSAFQLQENGRAFPPGFLHESWRDFLYWDSELDS